MFVTERFLRQVVVIKRLVALARDVEILTRAKARGRQYVADALTEVLDHAVGLRMARGDQAVLDAEQGALAVERVLAGRRFGLACEAIGELATVVGEQLVDLHRRGGVQPSQEIGAAGLSPIGVDAQMDPVARSIATNR